MAVIDVGVQTCFMCKTQVEVTSVVKTDSCHYVDLDFRPRGLSRYAEKNYVHFCNNCGYANFNLENDLTKGNPQFLDEEYKSVFEDQSCLIDGKKFYLVGLTLLKLNEYQRAATSFLRAAWFFGDLQCNEWMIKSRRRVIDILYDNEFTWKNSHTAIMLIDCLRRIGEFEQAIEVINRFKIDNVHDQINKEIFKFQLELCNKKDDSIHTTRELNLGEK